MSESAQISKHHVAASIDRMTQAISAQGQDLQGIKQDMRVHGEIIKGQGEAINRISETLEEVARLDERLITFTENDKLQKNRIWTHIDTMENKQTLQSIQAARNATLSGVLLSIALATIGALVARLTGLI